MVIFSSFLINIFVTFKKNFKIYLASRSQAPIMEECDFIYR